MQLLETKKIYSILIFKVQKLTNFYFHIILSPILVCIVSHLFKTLAIKKCPKRSRHGTPRRCGRSSLLVAKMASYFLHLQFCTIFSSANSITTFIFLPNVKTLSTQQSNKIFAKCNNRRAAFIHTEHRMTKYVCSTIPGQCSSSKYTLLFRIFHSTLTDYFPITL